MTLFEEQCTGCGACAAACPFLETYGTPDVILSERPEVSFYCTSCHSCDGLCPLELSPAAAFFDAKRDLLKTGRMPDTVRKGLAGAKEFAKVGHSFPFAFYGKAETVFWPGCGMSAHEPALVREVRNILNRHMRQRIGLVLDCCFDPVYEYGDTDTAMTALRDINRRLMDRGVKKVITGCLNCYKLLSEHLDGPEVVFLLDVIPPDAFGKMPQGPVHLHHPCPASRWQGIREKAERIVDPIPFSQGLAVPSIPTAGSSKPLCCGSGGGSVPFPHLWQTASWTESFREETEERSSPIASDAAIAF